MHMPHMRTLECLLCHCSVSCSGNSSKYCLSIRLPGGRGVHGPIIDLFETVEGLHTAVEVTAGNALFNVVVDSDAVASQIVEHLIRDRVGRITCLPLNRLNVSAALQNGQICMGAASASASIGSCFSVSALLLESPVSCFKHHLLPSSETVF